MQTIVLAKTTNLLGYIKMIVYGAKRVGGKLLLKRWFKMRSSGKRKRIDQEISKLRKMWWHFKTRWDT